MSRTSLRLMRVAAILLLGLLTSNISRAEGPILVRQTPRNEEAPRRLDLAGTWQFRTDADDVGVRDKWFERDWVSSREIRVPGAWNAQGVGFENPEDLRRYLRDGSFGVSPQPSGCRWR